MKTLPLSNQPPHRYSSIEIRAAKNGYIVFPNPDSFRNSALPSDSYFVFPDFASLTVWLRKNITHGGGITP